MQLRDDSKILMITSAGCNALDYLTEGVEKIHCVDLNYRQNAVLDLKMSLFKLGDYELLWDFFGEGRKENAGKIYNQFLYPLLNPESRKFWDRKIHYFESGSFRKSFYYRGSSGLLAWWVSRYLKLRPGLKKKIDRLLSIEDLEEQKTLIEVVQKEFFGFPLGAFINQIPIHYLAGVPVSQEKLVSDNGKEKMVQYLRCCFDKTFRHNSGASNYFYKVYFHGHYFKDCCPEYLKEENFETIKSQIEKLSFSTETVNAYLKRSKIQFTHFVLLDHMDWLAQNRPDLLEEEWELIGRNSTPAAKILFRSAASDASFLPSRVFQNFSLANGTEEVQKYDRVGMYRYTGLALKDN